MGSRWSKTEAGLSPSDTERLMEETGFAKSHVTMLHLRFRELDRGDKGYLEREDLLRLTQVGRALSAIARGCHQAKK